MWTPKVRPEVKLSKWFGGGSKKPNPKTPIIKAKRRRHGNEFKEKDGMEGLQRVKTIQQIGKEFEVHPVQALVIIQCSHWQRPEDDTSDGRDVP